MHWKTTNAYKDWKKVAGLQDRNVKNVVGEGMYIVDRWLIGKYTGKKYRADPRALLSLIVSTLSADGNRIVALHTNCRCCALYFLQRTPLCTILSNVNRVVCVVDRVVYAYVALYCMQCAALCTIQCDVDHIGVAIHQYAAIVQRTLLCTIDVIWCPFACTCVLLTLIFVNHAYSCKYIFIIWLTQLVLWFE